jgi:hypothetical protein
MYISEELNAQGVCVSYTINNVEAAELKKLLLRSDDLMSASITPTETSAVGVFKI